MQKTRTDHHVYQLYIMLENSNPPIWRRILLDSLTILPDLHGFIQVAMGWKDKHVHEFIIGDRSYDHPTPQDRMYEEVAHLDGHAQIGEPIMLQEFVEGEGFTFSYRYDFADNWKPLITIEEITIWTPDSILPLCLDGARACPPEDCGGIYHYNAMLPLLEKRKNAENLTPDEKKALKRFHWKFEPTTFPIKKVQQEYKDFKMSKVEANKRLKYFVEEQRQRKQAKNPDGPWGGTPREELGSPLTREFIQELLKKPLSKSSLPEIQQALQTLQKTNEYTEEVAEKALVIEFKSILRSMETRTRPYFNYFNELIEDLTLEV